VKETITARLLEKYINGKCSGAEKQLVDEWYRSFNDSAQLFQHENDPEFLQLKARVFSDIRLAVHAAGPEAVHSLPHKRMNYRHWKIAASILTGIGCAALIYFALLKTSHNNVNGYTNNVQTGADTMNAGVVLTLADGSTVALDGLNGRGKELGVQGDARIIGKNGNLVYQAGDTSAVNTLVYNKVATSRGKQYRITLSDGSAVWLNTTSSIRYPASFGPGERRVEIEGEAYFEVAKDPERPFIVVARSGELNREAEIRVLGTHFNVNAYSDEGEISTALLEGSVKVKSSGKEVLIQPGQKAGVSAPGSIQVSPADLEQAVAWKNGLFQFDNVSIATVMKEISRWYDVEVEFKKDVSNDRFIGKIYRTTTLPEVLKILELSGVRFVLHEKKLTVY
jgi:transmembrane sensor